MTEVEYKGVVPLCHQDMTTIYEFREFLKVWKPVLVPAYMQLRHESQLIVAEEYWKEVK